MMKFIKSLGITLFLIFNQNCVKEFQTEIISKEKLVNRAPDSLNNYYGFISTEVLKNQESLLNSTCHIYLKKIKWRDKNNWIINNLTFQDSKLGGFYLYHSPTVISCYESNNRLNFILDVDFQVANNVSKLTDISNGIMGYQRIQNSLKKLLEPNHEQQIDTIKILDDGSNLEKGTFVKMKKKILFQNDENGLIIKEVESYSSSDLTKLETIFGSDNFSILETKNLPKKLN